MCVFGVLFTIGIRHMFSGECILLLANMFCGIIIFIIFIFYYLVCSNLMSVNVCKQVCVCGKNQSFKQKKLRTIKILGVMIKTNSF